MKKSLKHPIDADLAERLHAFEMVVKIAIQLNVMKVGSAFKHGEKRQSLPAIGMQKFGLTQGETRYCVGRARNWLEEIRLAERARNAAALKRNPTQFSIAA